MTQRDHIIHLIGDIAHADMKVSEEMIVDEIAQVLQDSHIKLTDQEIRDVCDVYHESHGLNAESLEASNQLYMGLDHANNMVLI